MRRITSSALIGFGAFLVVAAALIKFYAYPQLATVPTNYDSTTELSAEGAQIFNSNPEVLAAETSDLTISAHTVADSSVNAPDGVATWVTSTTVRRADGSIFQQTTERVPFDAVSGAGVDCERCTPFNEVATYDGPDTVITREPVDRTGLQLKFPFDTQKKDYPVWDGTVGEPVVADFQGTTKIQGMTVYKFVQTVDRTVVESREIPGSVFGAGSGAVDADVTYGMTRTFFVEPVTGAVVNRIEERNQTLDHDGTSVPAFVGTVHFTDEQVSDMVEDVKFQATMLGGMRWTFPLIALVLGLGAIAGGIALRGGRRTAPAQHRDQELVSA